MTPPPTTVFISTSWNYDDVTIEGLLTPEEAEEVRKRNDAGRERDRAQHERDIESGQIMKGTPFRCWQGSGIEGPFVWNGERWIREEE